MLRRHFCPGPCGQHSGHRHTGPEQEDANSDQCVPPEPVLQRPSPGGLLYALQHHSNAHEEFCVRTNSLLSIAVLSG